MENSKIPNSTEIKNPEENSSKKKKKEKKGSEREETSWITEDTTGKAVHLTAAGASAAESATPIAGEGLATIGQAAPVLQVAAVAYDAYQIGRNVEKDRRRGTSRNTVKKVTTTVATYGGGVGGALAGAALGSALFPGVGTIIGGIVGGVTGGIGSGFGSGKAAEALLDHVEYDSKRILCATCQQSFVSRKYAVDEEETECEQCREK